MNVSTEHLPSMHIASAAGAPLRVEAEIYRSRLPLLNSRIVELGCGAADHTRAIAALGDGLQITACEVDAIAHEKNLAQEPHSAITFKLAGAEAIPEPDGSVDAVVMFKSLHHVPLDKMDQALSEIGRVLKLGGLLYISEPIFDGAFNDILRLFHDEELVRRAAFEATKSAVSAGLFELEEQLFFNAAVKFSDFQDFENKIIRATHSAHELDDATYAQVRRRFQAHASDTNEITFEAPMRVDLLRATGA